MRPPVRRALLAAGSVLALALLLALLLPAWPSRVTVEVRGTLPSWQLFFDQGRGFVERDSVWAAPGAVDARGWRRLEFVLPRVPVRALRLDPPGAATETRFGELCVEAELPWQRRRCVAAGEWRRLFIAVHDLEAASADADEVVLRHVGPDPYLAGDAASGDLARGVRGPRFAEMLGLLAAWGAAFLVCSRLRPGRTGRVAAACGGLVVALVWSLPAWPARLWLELRGDAATGWKLFAYHPEEPDPQLVQQAAPGDADAEGWRRLAFGLPARRAVALRFDPPDESGPVAVRRLCLAPLGVLPARCLDAEALSRAFPHRHDLELSASREALTVRTTGADPYFWSAFGEPALRAPLAVSGSQAAAAGALASLAVLLAGALGRTRGRRLATATLWFANLVVVPVVGVEALLWFAEPWLPGVWSLYDPDTGFRARPQASGANALGFPDRDYPFERVRGSFRVLVLGDSFGWVGRGRWNYTDLLETALAARFGAGRVEIVNAGFPAIGPPQQRELLRKWGLRYQPDLVLLASYLGNDVVDSDPRILRLFVGDQAVDRDAGDPPLVLFGRPLLPVSRLALALGGHYRPWGAVAVEPESGPFLLSHERYVATERGLLRPWCEPLRQQHAASLARFDASIEAIARDLRPRGIGFGMLALPAAWSVDPARAEPLLATFALPPGACDLSAGHAHVAALARRLETPLLDLLPVFAAAVAQGGESAYLVDDSHWSRSGNELAAAAIEPWLVERWLAPALASR